MEFDAAPVRPGRAPARPDATVGPPSGDVEVRATWRAVAIPAEHGGWGLTLEPVVLGLLVEWSVAGLALGLAAFTAFLLRTPAKLVAVDLRRGRWLERSRVALRVAAIEAMVLATCVVVAVREAGWTWWVPVAVAAPLVAVELWFEVRSRGRRLVPELCGAVGVAAVVAAVVVAGDGSGRLAAASWLVLAARAAGAIPFVRVQILRLRRGSGPVRHSDVAQAVSVGLGGVAVVVDGAALLGFVGVIVLAVLQVVAVRRAPVPAKRLGMRQMAMGLGLVLLTAVGASW